MMHIEMRRTLPMHNKQNMHAIMTLPRSKGRKAVSAYHRDVGEFQMPSGISSVWGAIKDPPPKTPPSTPLCRRRLANAQCRRIFCKKTPPYVLQKIVPVFFVKNRPWIFGQKSSPYFEKNRPISSEMGRWIRAKPQFLKNHSNKIK